MYLVFDSETQIHKKYKRTANPFIPENYVVARGWKKEGDAQNSVQFYKPSQDNWLVIDDDVTVLVGHNIKFDLLYEMQAGNPYLRDFYKRGGSIWCTQYAEYLLNAMQRQYHMNSMDGIIETYGGRKKIDGMKALWQAGVQTADIDPELVKDYLIGTEAEGRNSGDIGNTELIYLGQLKSAQSLGMTESLRLRMDGLAATTEMEYNGLKVCTTTAKKDLSLLNDQLKAAKKDLSKYIADIPEEVGFKWSSTVCKSAIIYGGSIRYRVRDTYLDEKTGKLARLKATEKWPLVNAVPVKPELLGTQTQDVFLSGKNKGKLRFKNVAVKGELKTKLQDRYYDLPGYVNPTEVGAEKTKNTDGRGNVLYSTDSETMIMLGNSDVPFLKALAQKIRLDKEIGTYYVTVDGNCNMKGMLTCVSPEDNVLHHMLNHTTTVTSRLSSSNPNCQNIPKSPSRVKAMFVSRFKDGMVGEIDYSQLEVVVQGLLTNDKQLVSDLINRVDFHCKRVSAKFNIDYKDAVKWCKDETDPNYKTWQPRRQGAKEFSFQRTYGAGASTIALSTGMSIQDVEELIEAENKLYPGVISFNAEVERTVTATAEGFRDPLMGYRAFRRGEWQSPTGTMYSWRTYDAPSFLKKRGIIDTFSPPELKNYPVQGTGGEIVQLVLGKLWRYFMKKDNWNGKAFLVNTVHDCVWFDMDASVAEEVLKTAKIIMEGVPTYLKKHFNIDCPVPFPVDVEMGRNMLDLHHLEA